MPQRIRDESNDHAFFALIPHLAIETLSASELKLLCHYKQVCGEKSDGACWESVRTTAKACGFSFRTVQYRRKALAEAGWVKLEVENPEHPGTITVTICDRWLENVTYRSAAHGKHPCQMGNAPMPNGQRPPAKRATKEEPMKKNDLRRDPPLSEGGTHKPIDPDFLADMTTTFRGVDVEREYAKFRDYNSAKGRRLKDNRAGFRLWLRKAEEFAGERKQRDTVKAGRGAIRGEDDLAAWDAYKKS